MIAANHPRLGMNVHQGGDNLSPIIGPGFQPRVLQPIRSVATPVTPPATATPAEPTQAPNVITPPPAVLPPGSSSALEEILPASVPASASVTGTDTTSTSTPFSLSDWITEETVWPGVPNGAVAAGALIALAWLFGGGKKRR